MGIERLRRWFPGGPRLLVALLAWLPLALLGVLACEVLSRGGRPALNALEIGLALSALAALSVGALIVVLFYLHVRHIRNKLFEGAYEEAYALASRHARASLGIDFANALDRLLQFDRRRAERVATTTRLIDRILREAPLPMLVGDLASEQVRLSLALCNLFRVSENRYPLDALLLPPANLEFARAWQAVANSARSSVDAVVTLHLPVRQSVRRLAIQLLGVQDDQGQIAYILGIARLPDQEAGQPPTNPDQVQL